MDLGEPVCVARGVVLETNERPISDEGRVELALQAECRVLAAAFGSERPWLLLVTYERELLVRRGLTHVPKALYLAGALFKLSYPLPVVVDLGLRYTYIQVHEAMTTKGEEAAADKIELALQLSGTRALGVYWWRDIEVYGRRVQGMVVSVQSLAHKKDVLPDVFHLRGEIYVRVKKLIGRYGTDPPSPRARTSYLYVREAELPSNVVRLHRAMNTLDEVGRLPPR